MKKIGVLVGSLRKESWNRKLALAMIKQSPASLEMKIIEIKPLTVYDQDPDDEGHPRAEWTTFRDQVKPMDGILFVTPEYNRSIPAPLKNAIDVGSRPYGKSVWGGKPCAIMSSSPGAIGGFGANQHLRQTFVFLDLFCMQQPEAYIGNISQLFDDQGNFAKEETKVFVQKFLDGFAGWVNKILG